MNEFLRDEMFSRAMNLYSSVFLKAVDTGLPDPVRYAQAAVDEFIKTFYKLEMENKHD